MTLPRPHKVESRRPRPSRRTLGIGAGVLALVVAVVLVAVLVPRHHPTTFATTGQEEIAPHHDGADVLAYEVAWPGDAPDDGAANIIYDDGDGSGQKELDGQALPWRVEFDRPETMHVAVVVASPAGTDALAITCRVLLNGDEVVTQTSTTDHWQTVACDADL